MKLIRKIIPLALAAGLMLSMGPALAGKAEGSVLPAAMLSSGEGTITITITNDNQPAEDGSGTLITDIFISSAAYPDILFDTAGASIAPGESKGFSSVLFFPEELLDVPIPFSVSWVEGDRAKSKDISVKVQRTKTSNLTVTRSASAKQASPGDEIALTYTLTNTGELPINVKSLIDREINGKASLCEPFELEPMGHREIPFTYTMGRSTVTSEPVVTYKHSGEEDTASAAPLILGMVNAKLAVEVLQGEPSPTGVLFTINLTNNGNQKISDIKILDDQGNRVNPDAFALAVGENRQLTCNVMTETERYVLFSITGVASSGEKYEYKTKSSVVRKYIDPSLLGIEFSAQVTESLNSAGSIEVKFDVNNVGTMSMQNLVISEQTSEIAQDGTVQPRLNEIFRTDTLPTGLFTTTHSVYVGEPRDLTFVVQLTDPAGNPFTYTAYVKAEYLGISDVQPTDEAQESAINTLGASVGSSINRALTIALIVLGALTLISVIAMAMIYYLEKKQRRDAARRRAARDRRRLREDHQDY